MTIQLTKSDLIKLVASRIPSNGYIGAEEANKKGWGELKGFPNESWTWNLNYLYSCSEEQLYQLYKELI